MHKLSDGEGTPGQVEGEQSLHRRYTLPINTTEDPPRWTLDDNMKAHALGFQILRDRDGVADLFAGRGYTDAAYFFEKRIKPYVWTDPFLRKAFTVLCRERMLHPDRRFKFQLEE